MSFSSKLLFMDTITNPKTLTEEELALKERRRAAREKGFGFLKGRIISSDDFLAEKHAETARELKKESEEIAR